MTELVVGFLLAVGVVYFADACWLRYVDGGEHLGFFTARWRVVRFWLKVIRLRREGYDVGVRPYYGYVGVRDFQYGSSSETHNVNANDTAP